MEVPNAKRILAVSLTEESHHLSQVIQDLTGTPPLPTNDTLAGTTHDLPLQTPYYKATIPIWLDVIASPADWASTFLTPEAEEVLAALGGVVIVFEIASVAKGESTRSFLRSVGRVVREGLGGWEWDGVALALGVGAAMGEDEEERVSGDCEDWCAEFGVEFVRVRGGVVDEGKNEFGEKMGINRVLEALQSNDWTAPRPDDLEDPSNPEDLDFNIEEGDPEDTKGLRLAILAAQDEVEPDPESKSKDKNEDDEPTELDDEDVRKVETMMRKLLAARAMGEGMPEGKRREMAKKAVEEVMREL